MAAAPQWAQPPQSPQQQFEPVRAWPSVSGSHRAVPASPPPPVPPPPVPAAPPRAQAQAQAPTAGGRRKRARRRTTPVTGAAAGVITLFAATSGAMGLQSQADADTTMTLHLQDPPPGPSTLSAAKLDEERAMAAARSRSARSSRSVAPSNAGRVDEAGAAEARERAAWERKRAAELAGLNEVEGFGISNLQMKRTVRWVLPLSNFRLSAGFGESGSLWSNDHTGQDFSARSGTPVRTVGAGEVTFAGWDGSYGNKIVVRHSDGTETWYSHLSGYERRSGTVAPGEVIGYVGSTGNSTGPHLHLEVRPYGGGPIDPLPWLRSFGLDI